MFIEQNSQMVKYMSRIDKAMETINDTNILHCSTLKDNTDSIKRIAEVSNSSLKFFKWIMTALIVAIIALAGAEKIIKLIPILK